MSADRLRVLVAEDSFDVAQGLVHLIGTWGHDTRVASDGPTAVTLAAEWDPHVALLDLGLPTLDGCAVARQIRAAAQRHVLLVAITGWAGNDQKQRAAEAGIHFWLKKPFDPDALRTVLDSAVASLRAASSSA